MPQINFLQFNQQKKQDMLLKVTKIISQLQTNQNILKFWCGSSDILLKRQIREKAMLSYNIMNIINEKPSFQNLDQSSIVDLQRLCLVDRIREGIQNYQEASPESKKEISSLFNEGVHIDKKIFSQLRIEKGKVSVQNPSESKQELKTFIFYPTYLVTSQMFNKLINLGNQKKLLVGHYGISKTVSVSLFWKLARYIDEYRFKKDQQIKEKQLFNVPKIVYWNVGFKDTLQKVQNLILDQCPQIKDLPQAQNFAENNIQLSSLYQKINPKTNTILLMDQINLFASLQRKYKALEEKKNTEGLDKNELQDFQEMKTILSRFKRILRKVLSSFDGVLYLSSMQLEQFLMKNFDLTNDNNHQKLEKQAINYSTQIFKPFSIFQLVNYFLFQFEQRVLGPKGMEKYDPSVKTQIIKQCFNYLNQGKKKQSFFFTILDIRQELKKISIKNCYELRKLSSKALIEYIFQKFRTIVDDSTQKYRDQLQGSFYKKDENDNIRRDIMLMLYSQCKRISSKKQEESKKNENKTDSQQKKSKISNRIDQDTSQINSYTPQNISIYNMGYPLNIINKYIDKRLFSIEDKTIRSQLPVQLIVEVLEPLIAENLQFYLKQNAEWLKYVMKDEFGRIIENIFIAALTQGKINLQLMLGNDAKVQFNNISKNPYWFKPLPVHYQIQNQAKEMKKKEQNKKETNQLKIYTEIRRKKKYSFLDSLIPSLEDMIKKNVQSAVFLPQKSNQKDKKKILQSIDKKSKSIDLIMVKKIKHSRSQFFQIYAIDLTTSFKNKDEIKDKARKFINEFIAFEDRAKQSFIFNQQDQEKVQIPVELNYYVFSPKSSVPSQDKNLNTYYGDYINFKKSADDRISIVTKLEGSQHTMLKAVGYIDLGSEVIFKNKENKEVARFQHTLAEFAIKNLQDKNK